jgi:hypothetical protein
MAASSDRAALRWDAGNERRSIDRGQEEGGTGVEKVARDLIARFYAALPNGLPRRGPQRPISNCPGRACGRSRPFYRSCNRGSIRPSQRRATAFGRASGRTIPCVALAHVQEGCRYVLDLDLEKFFDRVNHASLMGRLAKRIGSPSAAARSPLPQRGHTHRRGSNRA